MLSRKAVGLAVIAISAAADAFVSSPSNGRTQTPITCVARNGRRTRRHGSFFSTTRLNGSDDDDDQEIERLKKMAAKLRAEAAALEADKAAQLAEAAEKAFERFDINSDGEVSLAELKTGLEKELKVNFRQEML